MDLADGIRAFLAVVETGSFTAAGQRLGVSNKQAGKQVAALEARLGQNLLYRTTRAVSLTEAGETWLPHARKVLSALEDAVSVFADPAGGLSGRLRITCGARASARARLTSARGCRRRRWQSPSPRPARQENAAPCPSAPARKPSLWCSAVTGANPRPTS